VRPYVNNQLIIDDFSSTATPDTPISAAPPVVPISGKIHLQAGVAYDVRLEAKNLGATGLPAGLVPASGLLVSWASLQPPPTLNGCNAVILALGTNEQYESEGHDRSFRLPEQQDTLIQNVAEVNPRTIVVLHGDGGFDVQSWIDRVPALLHA
jgi:beta-glucosidase